MAVYKIAQLGTGWAVFRIDGSRFAQVDGPFPCRDEALVRQCMLEKSEGLGDRPEAGEASHACDD